MSLGNNFWAKFDDLCWHLILHFISCTYNLNFSWQKYTKWSFDFVALQFSSVQLNENVLSFRVPTYSHTFFVLYVIIHIKWFISEVFSLMCPIYRQNISYFLHSVGRASFFGTPCICAGASALYLNVKATIFSPSPIVGYVWSNMAFNIVSHPNSRQSRHIHAGMRV